LPQTIAEFVADRCNSRDIREFLFILPGLHEVKQRNRSGRNNRGLLNTRGHRFTVQKTSSKMKQFRQYSTSMKLKLVEKMSYYLWFQC
jgi:hypothetical protein